MSKERCVVCEVELSVMRFSCWLPLGFILSLFSKINANENLCSGIENNGECRSEEEIKIPNYASSDGRAKEAPIECFDRHPDCHFFVSQGECTKNPGEQVIELL